MINGIINLYKEQGFTSLDAVQVMRGIAGQRKVGHTGTLDPNACGVLPVCLGNATKLCDMLTDRTKEYVATFVLGKRTDTLDIFGKILEEREVKVKEEDLRDAILSFVGGYNQVPPMYSAKKIDGKRLYDLARSGKEVKRQAVHVDIYDMEILDVSLPNVTIRISCGKGTYIRSLCSDIGAKVNELATMTSLERTRVGNFLIKDSLTLSQLKDLKEKGLLDTAVIPTDFAFSSYKKACVKPEARKFLDNGNKLLRNFIEEDCEFSDGETVRVYNNEGRFSGLYVYYKDENLFKPYKMFLGE